MAAAPEARKEVMELARPGVAQHINDESSLRPAVQMCLLGQQLTTDDRPSSLSVCPSVCLLHAAWKL